MPHVRRHWTGTSCLCICHYTGEPCDDKTCKRVVTAETKALMAAEAEAGPMRATAGSTYVEHFSTPLGYTSRFSR